MQFRDLQKQYQELKPEIDAAVTKVMTDCNFISGAQVKALEQKLAEYVGVKHCITCANGTDALKLAERAYGIGAGHAVFVPDFTFFSTAETVADLGAVNIFVDVGENAYFGVASCTRNRISIGENSVIGMGSTVTKSVAENVTVVGNPARPLEKRR
ncbi:MAG: DegT/DnrJ/EryC1/StrS family aminotransferase [Oscillospiraceae bacterium]|nr:DegT/DnrJ/EryC1/StrS family aminotransferase [Oscillospiraceae bacterium]